MLHILSLIMILFINFDHIKADERQNHFEWETISLAKAGLDSLILNEMISDIEAGSFNDIHNILIVKDSKLVFEKYFNDNSEIYARKQSHEIQSITKSVTSLLIGIAIEKGYIENLDLTFAELFPSYIPDLPVYDSITLECILTMSVGLEWNELSVGYADSENDVWELTRRADWLKYVLDKPVVEPPGEHFRYNTGATVLLGAIIKDKTGMQADEFADKFLFEPLDINTDFWHKDRHGMPHTGGGLHLCPRDLVKIGQLVLNNGEWDDKQIVPKQWLDKSFQRYLNLGTGYYGYLWWLFDFETLDGIKYKLIRGIGIGGQNLLILPKLNVVVVFNAGNYNIYDGTLDVLREYILPAMNAVD